MKHILVAVDLSEGSLKALGRAARIASANGAAMRVLYSEGAGPYASGWRETRARVREAAQAEVDALPGTRPSFSVRLCQTQPELAILTEARKVGADLIVLGAHSEPSLRDAVFGTTATHVVRHSDRPVLVVQKDVAFPYRKAMAAIADVSRARPIFQCLLTVAPAAEFWAIHAWSPQLRQILSGRTELDRLEVLRAEEAEAAIKAICGIGAELEVHVIAEAGDVLTVLMKEDKDLSPELLVMGTRHRATFLGSFAVDALFWCEHDILIVPDPQPEDQVAVSAPAMVMV